MRGRFVRAAWVVIGLSLAGAAVAKERYQRVVPPEHVIEGLKKVVIVDNGGGWNQHFRDAVARSLRSQVGHDDSVPEADAGLRAGLVDFVVVKGSATPGADEVKKLAAANGAQAVLVVTAGGKQTAYETYSEDRTKTVTQNGETKEENYTVSCARRDAEASWTAALYLGSDGGEVMHTSQGGNLTSKDCDEEGDDPLKVKSEEELIGDLLNSGAPALAMKFNPYWASVRVAFARDKASSDAVALADKSGDWQGAVEVARSVLADDPYNAPAIYLIGFALEVGGRAEDAVVVYKLAARMKDDAVYQQAVTRARQRVEELATLSRAYGIKPTRANFTGVDEVIARAKQAADIPVAGVPAEIKGTRNKRVPVFKANDPTSEILMMLPGDTEVRRISQANGMVQIQLPDGQQGWVSSDLIK